MAVGAIELLKLPCSLSTGEYPLLTDASADLTEYTAATFEVRYTESYQQSIRVPYVEGYRLINAARMGGLMWWVVDITTASDLQHQMTLHLTLNGPSSLLHKGESVEGEWSRLPTNACDWLPRAPRSSAMQCSRTIALPRLPVMTATLSKSSAYWVQVTSTERITDSGTEQDHLTRYGFFCAYTASASSSAIGILDKTVDDIQASFPELTLLINYPEEYGFTASNILDISISSRCPYAYEVDQESVAMKITGAENTLHTVKVGTYYAYGYYVIDSAPSAFEVNAQTLSVSLSAFERQCGSVTLRDHNGSVLGVIDPSWSVSGVKVSTVSDFGSLITQVDINGSIFTIAEGHVPWVGNAWDEYRKFSLAYDREAMNNSIDFANQRLAVGIAQNAASTIQSAALGAIGGGLGAVSGAIGGAASFGISTWASYRENEISQAETRAEQELAERRVKGQAGTAYNTGYGLIYVFQTINQPACIQVDLPAGLTSSIDSAYTKRHGYPAEGPRTQTISAGYYRGMIFATKSKTGLILDRCNGAMSSGLFFKEV